jgi:arsenite methyltransferase
MAPAWFEEKSLAAERPKADYGIDAPNVIRNLILIGLVAALAWASPLVGIWPGVLHFSIGSKEITFDVAGTGLWVAMVCCFMACWMIYDSKVGKLALREELLGKVSWVGSEQVLDVGCGRGLLLIGAAKRLKTGRAVGIDLWQSEDLSNNNAAATIANARVEGVADRVEVQTGDMRHMPFVTGQFDVIVSRAAIHNLYQADQREEALHEMVRVLKPAGVLLIDDIRHIREYQHVFNGLGCTVTRSGSELMSLLLMILTWGSLRPGTLLVRKNASSSQSQS